MCHGETIFSATLKLFVPEESDDSPTELSIVPTTVSNDEIETVDEVSSIVVGTQPTPSQVVEVIMENVSMGYNLGNALELILLHPEKNEALELAILAIKRQINLNSKKLNK